MCLSKGHVGSIVCLIKGHVGGVVCLIKGIVDLFEVWSV